VNSLPKTVTRQRRDCDMNPGPPAPESSALTTRLPRQPCETLMSAKQGINDKLQGSVAKCLTCGGVVSNQIKIGLLLSPLVDFFFKSVNVWQSYEQERGSLVHFFRLSAVCWPGVQSARDNHVLACNFTEYLLTDVVRLSYRRSITAGYSVGL